MMDTGLNRMWPTISSSNSATSETSTKPPLRKASTRLASATLELITPPFPHLSVDGDDIGFDPAAPDHGDEVTISGPYGRFHALVLGIIVLAIGLTLTLMIVSGRFAADIDSDLLDRLRGTDLFGFQLFSFLAILFAFGLATHLVALANQFGSRN